MFAPARIALAITGAALLLAACAAPAPTRYELTSHSGLLLTASNAERLFAESITRRTASLVPARLDAPLTAITIKFPAYPRQAAIDGIEGDVMVEFTVDEAGLVRTPRSVRSPDPALSQAAEEAVATWQFERPTRNGQPTSIRVQIPLAFRLR